MHSLTNSIGVWHCVCPKIGGENQREQEDRRDPKMNMGGATIERLTNDTNYHSDIHPDSQMYKINPFNDCPL